MADRNTPMMDGELIALGGRYARLWRAWSTHT